MTDLGLDSFGTEESGLTDLDVDSFGLDNFGTDENQMGEESVINDMSLDNLEVGDTGQDEGMSGDLSLDDLLAGGLGQEDTGLSDLTLDDLNAGEAGLTDLDADSFGAEEQPAGDFSLDDLALGDLGQSDAGTDDLSLDSFGMEDGLEDLTLDELEAGEAGLGGLGLDNLGAGENQTEDILLDNLGEESMTDDLDSFMDGMDEELSLDDLALEEGPMSEEDIDRLLSGENLGGEDSMQMDDGQNLSDDFALEDAGDQDDDLSALLAGMGHDDDLSEISDLLEKSEQGVSADDDMLAMLGESDNDSFSFFSEDNDAGEAAGIREVSSGDSDEKENPKEKKEKRRRKKREKKPRKKKGANQEAGSEDTQQGGLEDLLETTQEKEEEKPEKQSFGAKLMSLLFDSDEDEKPVAEDEDALWNDTMQMGSLTEENKEILQELSDEDKKGSKKKGKKDKKKKKGKKGKGEVEEITEDGEELEEIEKKEKKSKRKKKKKKGEDTGEEELAVPEKKLSKKKVISVFLFCGTIAASIILLSSFLPMYLQKNDAKIAYDYGYYGDVYDLLYGKQLNEEEEALFKKSSLVLQMDRKITSYENYNRMGMRIEALDALISGVERYQTLQPQAEKYNVEGPVRERYEQIVDCLSADFGVSETDALDIIASEDDVTYSQRLYDIINGVAYGAEGDLPEVKQDVLPEEEEIISRLEDVEQADGSDN